MLSFKQYLTEIKNVDKQVLLSTKFEKIGSGEDKHKISDIFHDMIMNKQMDVFGKVKVDTTSNDNPSHWNKLRNILKDKTDDIMEKHILDRAFHEAAMSVPMWNVQLQNLKGMSKKLKDDVHVLDVLEKYKQ
jgi:hypothetical protein